MGTEAGLSRFSRKRLERSFDQVVRNASHLAGQVGSPVLGLADRVRARPYDVGPLPAVPGHIIAVSAHRSTPGRKYLALAASSLLRQAPTVGFAVFVNGPCSVQVVAEELRESGRLDGLQIEVVSEQEAPDYLLEHRSRIACIEPTVKGNPWRLTWSHKKLLSDLVLHHRAFDSITHLIDSEDDMALPPDALRYWCTYRPALAPYGLLPGFIRVEGPDDGLCVTGWRRRSDGRPRVALRSLTDGAAEGKVVWFVNLSNPYQAMYVLDQELAEWHFRYSDFRSLRRSKLSTTFGGRWGVPERAAAGAIFDAAIPPGYHSRNVLPLIARGAGHAYPLKPCLVRHLPWKDYRDDRAPQGKRLVSETFKLDPPLASELANL